VEAPNEGHNSDGAAFPALDMEGYRALVRAADAESEAMSVTDQNLCSSGRAYDARADRCKFTARVERRATISAHELAHFFQVARPLILTNLTDRWAAFERWTLAHLKERYGHLEVSVQAGRVASPDYEVRQHLLRTTMRFGQFLDEVARNERPNDLYLTGNNRALQILGSAGMLDDMEPFYEGLQTAPVPNQTHLWVGGAGTRTPLHYDPVSILHTQVKGRKVWRLYAPEMTPYLYPRRHKQYAMVSEVDVHAADHSRFPLFRRAFPVDVTLQEGETLFLPTGWWHAVDGLDTPSISVGATSWLARFVPLERRLMAVFHPEGAQGILRRKPRKLPAMLRRFWNRWVG